MVHVAEESGTMPETFGRLAKIYLEKSDSAIRALTSALSWLVWIGVACVIVFYIFRFASAYIGAIQGFQAE
jgi:type II secretory pathway component PulF